jgi:hypothetical protein
VGHFAGVGRARLLLVVVAGSVVVVAPVVTIVTSHTCICEVTQERR